MFSFVYTLKCLIVGSIYFVWVVRYQNIIEEFKVYGLPPWLRDIVGILKISFCLMLFSSDIHVVIQGATGIIILMLAALATHIRIKNEFYKMMPAIMLIMICCLVIFFTFQYL
jgi:hypothetical protein